MKTKIFQIGFNKCGTLSIHDFLVENGIRSVHYLKGDLANTIFDNHKNGVDLLSGLGEFDAFSDMESLTSEAFQYVANDLFKELHQAYPEAIFILNTRNVENWIESRLRHGGGTYLDRYRCILDQPKAGVIKFWRAQYESHIKNVKHYFAQHPDAHFIHLALDTCEPDELGLFLTKAGIKLKSLTLPHVHKSLGKRSPQKKQHLSALLDAAWYFKKIDVELSRSLFSNALKIDPNNIYAKKMLAGTRPSFIHHLLNKIKITFGDKL